MGQAPTPQSQALADNIWPGQVPASNMNYRQLIGWICQAPVYSIFGSEGEGGGDGGGNSGNAGGDGGEGGSGSNDDGTGGNSSDPKDQLIANLRRENAAKRKELGDGKKYAEDLEKRLQAIEDKDKSELEKAQRDLKAATERNDVLAKANKQLALEKAFLSQKVDWHDPEMAMRGIDLDKFEISDDGTVEGLADAVKEFAKSHKYLVKSKSDEGGEGEDGGGAPPPTGGNFNGSGKGTKDRQTDRQRLEGRFPQLNRGVQIP